MAWDALRMEPYDPDARDADGDGIVQERTPWERPAGTRLLDQLGQPIDRGRSSGSRPAGLRIVDAQGKPVTYTPTYERSEGPSGGPTPLSDYGALSLREMGLPTVSTLVPKRITPEPREEPAIEEPPTDYRITPSPRVREAKDELAKFADKIDEATEGLLKRKLSASQEAIRQRWEAAINAIYPYVDEYHEKRALSKIAMSSLYWAFAAKPVGSAVVDFLHNFWQPSTDSTIQSLQKYIEEMWVIGGAPLLAWPVRMAILKLKVAPPEKFVQFIEKTKQHFAQKGLKAGVLIHNWQYRLFSRLEQLEKKLDATEGSVETVQDVTRLLEKPLPATEEVADLHETSGTAESILAKNKRILAAIEASGGQFGNPSIEFAKDPYVIRGSGAYPVQSTEAVVEEYKKQASKVIDDLKESLAREMNGEADPTKVSYTAKLPQEVKDMLLSMSEEELLDVVQQEMMKLHQSMGKRVYSQVPASRLLSILSEGRAKTTHEAQSDHSGPDVRVQYETVIGIHPDAPAELRPVSGYVISSEWGALPEDEYETPKLADVGHVEAYGQVQVKLKEEVAGRSVHGYADSLNNHLFAAPMLDPDPDVIAAAYGLTRGHHLDDQHTQILRFLIAHQTGSLGLSNAVRPVDLTPVASGVESDRDMQVRLRKRQYFEALIAGGYTPNEIESISMPSDALRSISDFPPMKDAQKEILPVDKLRDLGFTEEEIDYLYTQIEKEDWTLSSGISSLLSKINELIAYRAQKEKKKELDAHAERYGIKVFITTGRGVDNPFSPSYQGDHEQKLISRIEGSALREVQHAIALEEQVRQERLNPPKETGFLPL